jgi:hypothetical protein
VPFAKKRGMLLTDYESIMKKNANEQEGRWGTGNRICP